MLRVGLTGGIGAGKSTVARRLVERGAVLVDSDVLAREVVAPGSPGLAEVVAAFGEGVLDVYHAGNFVDVIRGKATTLNSPITEGHISTTLCHLGNMAYRTNSVLTVDPTTGRPSAMASQTASPREV